MRTTYREVGWHFINLMVRWHCPTIPSRFCMCECNHSLFSFSLSLLSAAVWSIGNKDWSTEMNASSWTDHRGTFLIFHLLMIWILGMGRISVTTKSQSMPMMSGIDMSSRTRTSQGLTHHGIGNLTPIGPDWLHYTMKHISPPGFVALNELNRVGLAHMHLLHFAWTLKCHPCWALQLLS